MLKGIDIKGFFKKRKFFLLIGFFFLLGVTNSQGLEYRFAKGKTFDVPTRELSIIATEEGYYPQSFSVFVGEKIRFFLTTTSNIPSCLIIREKEFYLAGTKGNVSEGVVYFEKPGSYQFYCPTNKIKGRLSVIKRPKTAEEVIQARKRKVASESKIKIWYPKDE